MGNELIESEVKASQRLDVLRQETALLREQLDRSMTETSIISVHNSSSAVELQVALKHRQETPVTNITSTMIKPWTPSLPSSRTFLTSVPSSITVNDKSIISEQLSPSLEESSITQPTLHRSGSTINSSTSSHTPSPLQLSRIMSRLSTRQSIVFRDSLNQSHVELKALARLRSNRLSVHENAARGE